MNLWPYHNPVVFAISRRLFLDIRKKTQGKTPRNSSLIVSSSTIDKIYEITLFTKIGTIIVNFVPIFVKSVNFVSIFVKSVNFVNFVNGKWTHYNKRFSWEQSQAFRLEGSHMASELFFNASRVCWYTRLSQICPCYTFPQIVLVSRPVRAQAIKY